MGHLVEQHGAGPLGDSLDGTFCYAILVVGTRSRVVNCLFPRSKLSSKFSSMEWVVVSSKRLQFDAILMCHLFKQNLSPDCVNSTERTLMAMEDESRGMINKDGPTNILGFGRFLASGVGQSSGHRALVVVN